MPESTIIKRRLLTLLAENEIDNVVDSYYDGTLSGESPEEAEAAIFAGDDNLPVVIYVQSEQALKHTVMLIEVHFKSLLVPLVRKLEESELGSAWSEGAVFETEHFVIAPVGVPHPEQYKEKKIILVHPGAAFGNGQHVSTLAMLRCLESARIDVTKRILDLGTGNGVLLIAAAQLGAKSLLGTDLSQDILDEAKRNFDLNGIKAETLLTTSVPVSNGPFDLVLVNIPIAGIRPLLAEILAATSSDAQIMFSGFTASDGQIFAKELASAGLLLVSDQEVRGWVALSFRKKKLLSVRNSAE